MLSTTIKILKEESVIISLKKLLIIAGALLVLAVVVVACGPKTTPEPTEETVPVSSVAFQAAYNYQYSIKDPGVFAHNPKYIMQILIDSSEAIGGDFSLYTRP